jgi:hypothetical protein
MKYIVTLFTALVFITIQLPAFAAPDDRQERRQERPDKRQDNRQERGRSDERQDKRDCRQEEGRVGKDKRDCKQEEVRDGVRGNRGSGSNNDDD